MANASPKPSETTFAEQYATQSQCHRSGLQRRMPCRGLPGIASPLRKKEMIMDARFPIFQIFASATWGGGEQFVADLSRRLLDDGRPVVFVSRRSRAIAEHTADIGAPASLLAAQGDARFGVCAVAGPTAIALSARNNPCPPLQRCLHGALCAGSCPAFRLSAADRSHSPSCPSGQKRAAPPVDVPAARPGGVRFGAGPA